MSKDLSKIKTIIFDFDGTIADTLLLGVEVINALAEQYGYQKIRDAAHLKQLQMMPTQEAIKAIGISYFKLPFIANSFRKKLSMQIDRLEPFEAMVPVIKRLASQYQLGVVTSNSSKNLDYFLDQHQLQDCFQIYSTGIRLFKKSKTIESIITKRNLDRKSVLLVGDETRDIEAAKKCKLPIVSVGWGFHAGEVLLHFSPDYHITQPSQLLTLLNAK